MAEAKRYRNTYTQAVSIWHARHGEKGKFKTVKKGTPEYQKVLEIKKEIEEGKIAKSLYTPEQVAANKAKRKPRAPRQPKTPAAPVEASSAPLASIAPATTEPPKQTIETKPQIEQSAPVVPTPTVSVSAPSDVEADISKAMDKLLTAKKNRRATKALNKAK